MISAGLIAGSIIFWSLKLGIGPTPTSSKVRSSIRRIIPDDVSGEIIELGCGWGHLIPILREKYPSKKIHAWERSPIPAIFTQGVYRIEVKRDDFFKANFEKAGFIICYLFPGAMERVEKEIIPQLPPGCWILTHTFSLSKRVPVKTLKANDLYQTQVYLYQTPL
ncbi:hypothetical protein GV64_14695 [Endozoicomonas elysicola]|uniref:Methyltransferase domain-containing protein n=2 Tax=Endozoicomonas elysicola TaxID=305900 RepID=A0A081KCE4_9GAMM|nr:hypothetical protein GV64_14695 [Endozoicomonas elysicola]